MVDINGDGIVYGNIRYMYITGNGEALQLSGGLECKRPEINALCSDIASAVYKLQDALSEHNRSNEILMGKNNEKTYTE
jgi:hypothetical protein